MKNTVLNQYPYYFWVYYFLFYAGFAITNIYIPIYLENINYSQSAIGLLLSVGPIATMLGQPLWGIAGDRAKNKVSVLRLLVAGITLSVAVFTLSANFIFLLVVITALTFFQSALPPTSDAITLEYLESSRWKYGPIRTAGTLGFIIVAILAGFMTKNSIGSIFILCIFLFLLTLIPTYMIPVIPGHLSKKSKLSLLTLLRNRKIMVIMFFVLITHSFIGFYNIFFPIFFKHLGSDNTLVGISLAVAAISEIPFVFWGDKLLDKFGTKRIIFGSTILLSLRWLLMYFANDTYSVLFIQLLHGPSMILLLISMVVYVSKTVPKELKVTGQTLYAMVNSGLSRIIGSALGGFLSDMLGIKYVFLIGAVMTIFSVIFFRNMFSENAEDYQIKEGHSST